MADKPTSILRRLGILYNRSFDDPDGHVWEAVWMDMSAAGGPGD